MKRIQYARCRFCAIVLFIVLLVVTFDVSWSGRKPSIGTPDTSVNLTALRNLIVVPCHATLRMDVFGMDTAEEVSWMLESHLRGKGIISMVTKHIRTALELASKDPQSLVLFSGGVTKKGSNWSEGASYMQHAIRSQWWEYSGTTVLDRVFPEEDARDSFENILFSLCRFHALTANYPSHITIVGMDYKMKRFIGLHRVALRIPLSYLTYVGLPDGSHGLDDSRSLRVFEKDPFGCEGNAELRALRNPTHRGVPYYDPGMCPALRPLLSYCMERYQ